MGDPVIQIISTNISMKVGIIYDKSFKNQFGPSLASIKSKINGVLTHAQAWHLHSTLYSKFTFCLDPVWTYYDGNIRATGSHIT